MTSKKKMNDDALLYSKRSDLQKTDATYVLEKYSKLAKWHDGDNILDVGAGEGTVSLNVLLPKLPANFGTLVLSDISSEMLKFAQRGCRDERVGFLQMDISSTIPEGLQNRFDHIFSFYCLQWVVDEKRQERAWKNLFDLLKPGGDILVTLIANAPPYDFSENMAKMEKWAPFMLNVKEVISPYHHLENPSEKLKSFLERTGFVINVCECVERCYVFSNISEFLEWGLSVNPFFKSLPEDEHAGFLEEYTRQTFKNDKITIDRDEKIYKKYKILIAYAMKPLSNETNI